MVCIVLFIDFLAKIRQFSLISPIQSLYFNNKSYAILTDLKLWQIICCYYKKRML